MLARDELTDPERKVWEAFESGATIDLRTGNSESDDPATGETWDTKRQIRAQLLFDLVTKAGGPAGPGCVPWSGGNEGVVVNLSDGARAGR
jgi:hypothetical protein